MMRVVKIVAFLGTILLFLVSVSQARDYQWPLKIKPRLSSHFGDYRAGHWHAGLDITTRGKTGYKVYAADDGYISRIRAGFWGYGKALYLKLNNGQFAVYGHLTRFSHDVEDYLRREQRKNRSYYQDIFFKPDQYPVKKGDYIALSGQSGAGAPHLHFEIRNSDNYPINPLIGYFKLPDSHPPKPDLLAVKRYYKAGLANYHDREFVQIEGQSPNYLVTDTISLYGEMVLAISAFDKNNSFNYGIYGAAMILDGKEIFAFNNDRLNYESGHQIDYVRDNSLKALVEELSGLKADNDKNVFYRLYVQPDDRQSFYGNYKYPAGIIIADSLAEGIHNLQINLYDENGNRSRVQLILNKAIFEKPSLDKMERINDMLTLHFKEMPTAAEPQIQRRRSAHLPYENVKIDFNDYEKTATISSIRDNYDYRLRIMNNKSGFSPWVEFRPSPDKESVIPYADYLDVVLNNDEAVTVNERMLTSFYTFPLNNNYLKAQVPVPVDNGYFKMALAENPGNIGYYTFDNGGRAFSPDSSVALSLSPDQLYSKVILSITEPRKDEKGDYIFEILPGELLFKAEVEIRIHPERLGIQGNKASLYYYSVKKSRWFFIGDESSESLIGKTGGGGRFGILKDSQKPVIRRIRPKNKSRVKDRTPILSCAITDNLSGFKHENQLEMTIDGYWVPAYYDIDNKTFSYKVRNKLKKGQHKLRITAIDRQGNKASAASVFTIR
ncbi:MAG: M23 family metallopeptidase [candidate division Zixibacteria bacterium]|nr:M23 family metallopeptidase [candidate division Zixibacteria bacterium]